MKKIYLLSLLFIFGFGVGQTLEYDYTNPMSPEAYQFKKRFGNEVSEYTGQTDIKIPLYSINLDGLEVPITLSYNTGGIKTDEEATIIGLGWSLNFGGEINRTNEGAPDERFFMTENYNASELGVGSLQVPKNFAAPGATVGLISESSIGQYASMDRWSFVNYAYYSNDPTSSTSVVRDSRPDEFYYNFPGGKSGKFMFSQKLGKFITFPLDDININYTISNPNNTPNGQKLDFIIGLSNGFKTLFQHNGVRGMYSDINMFSFDQSWQISYLVSPKGNQISYTYSPINYALCTNYGGYFEKVVGLDGMYNIGQDYNCNHYTNYDNMLTKIDFPSGYILFNYTNRSDLPTGSERLANIIVYNKSGQQIKQIKFDQSYFTANTDLSITGTITDTYANNRVRLDAVEISGTGNTAANEVEKYTFDYYTNSANKIPSKNTSNRDHWNYYNGGGTILQYGDQMPKDRFVDPNYSNTFNLKTIQFPEGGRKLFIYENNDAIPENQQVSDYYDDLTTNNFQTNFYNFIVSGYSLTNFYPASSGTSPDSTPGNKVFYGQPFTISPADIEPIGGGDLVMQSTLPTTVPNYSSIDSVYNNVVFEIQKFDGSQFNTVTALGTITASKANQIISNFSLTTPGTYRFGVIVNQTYTMPSNINYPHSTSIYLKSRTRISNTVWVGGNRIKEIDSFTNPSNSTSPDYKEQYSYLGDNGQSSGNIVNVPSYYFFVNIGDCANTLFGIPGPSGTVYDCQQQGGTKFSSNPVSSLYKTQNSNVGYTKVTKIRINVMDNSTIKESSYFSFVTPLFSSLDGFAYLKNQEPRDWQRGKLIKHISFKGSDTLKVEQYQYYGKNIEFNHNEVDEVNWNLLDYTEMNPGLAQKISRHINLIAGNPARQLGIVSPTTLLSGNTYFSANKFFVDNVSFNMGNAIIPYFINYTGFDKISSKQQIDYLNGKKLLTTVKYAYDTVNYYQLKSETTTFPDGKIHTKNYRYAQDIGNQLMVNNYMVGIPLEIDESLNNKPLSKKEYIFPTSVPTAQANNLIVPLSIQTTTTNTIGTAQEQKIIEETYDKYDSAGNLQQFTSKDGVPTSIIWGYNQTEPIAKVEGAKYSDISSLASNIIASSDPTQTSYSETTLMNNLTTFRNSLPNYIVTTYIHTPLIGVRSITPPSGITENYVYGTANHLQQIKDVNNNVIKNFSYNYVNNISTTPISVYFNSPIRQTFQRNNCGGGYTAGSYVYAIPGNKYVSFLSQADADQQAQNDINANGQNSANLNATCTALPNFTPVSNSFFQVNQDSFSQDATNTNVIDVTYSFMQLYQTSSVNWSNGVMVGSTGGVCVPGAVRNITTADAGSKTMWNIVVDAAGSVTLKLISGSVVMGNPINLSFQYQK